MNIMYGRRREQLRGQAAIVPNYPTRRQGQIVVKHVLQTAVKATPDI
jgi:hypothetical protein